MKQAHLALYLRCKESLRAHKMRLARNKRIGQCVRLLCSAVFLTPVRAVHRLLRRSTDLAIECLPQSEPAARQVRKLTAEAEFAREQSAFVAGSVPTPLKPDADSSPAKSA